MSQPPRPDTGSDRGSAKAQLFAKNLVAAFYMLVRSVKLYDPDNAIFQKPLQVLLDSANAIVARDGKLELAVVEQNFYVNGLMVRVEGNSLESLRYLASEMEQRQVGGFNLQRPTTVQELKSFVAVFAKDQVGAAPEDGLADKKLVSMKLTRWKKIQEKLEGDADGKVDRKKYAMTVYARVVLLASQLIDDLRAGKPVVAEPVLRQMQELVDLMRAQRTQFLGMTCVGEGERALSHHLVNTALLAVAFGSELGLDRLQLRELAYAALMVDLPLAGLPAKLQFDVEPEKLPKDELAALVAARRAGQRAVLAGGAPSHAQQMQVAVAAEAVAAFGKPVRDARGQITMILPQGEPMLLARLVAIARYFDLLTSSVPGREALGPEVAFDVMWSRQRFRFDPELLGAFIQMMGNQPIKRLEGAQGGTVQLGM